MVNIEVLKSIVENIKNDASKSLNMSLKDVHAKGMFSLVVKGSEFGKLTRIFIADKKLRPFDVQYHTHRYPIKLTAIKGSILHHTAKESEKGINISMYNYKSPLNGGSGLSFNRSTVVECFDHLLPIGSYIYLGINDFHTVSCSKGSMWIVEEMGFETDESRVLGVPFILDDLYSKPEMFQINDKVQLVLKEIKSIIQAYELNS